ncbi:hypothetical protein JYU34_011028 [Plutella xylostella]|uniref:Uncharacterized protein n=1 Tax=Plutella xylostella TaxID=51655 RepID=A0ABQ7QFX1_PLUXY|nr:hypothetical protein JYU34_011028 [Plutella xylostella]
MARKYMERRFSKSHRSDRTTIPASFKIPEPHEFYHKATPFVQRTLLFVADESTAPKPAQASTAAASADRIEHAPPQESTSTKPTEQEKSPKKSFFFSPSKSCKLHGRSFFRLQTSPKKAKSEASPAATSDLAGEEPGEAAAGAAAGAGGAGGAGLISYAPGWSLKGQHLKKWQASSGKTTVEESSLFYEVPRL